MAQRNPMNDRYQGDGPGGKTRKSAAKLKPKTEAASSVHIEKKPQTKQERKAARKKRDKQIAAKEAERKRKKEEREKQEKLAAGEEIEEPKAATIGEKVKKFVAPAPKEPAQPAAAAPARGKGPNTPEYKRLKKIYWTLMGVGIAAIALSLLMNFQFPELMGGWGMMVPMGIAYVAVIGAIILDYTKIRKMQRAHVGDGSRKSPKQLKHEQQKAEAAALLEESKKAQREQKRANSKIPFISKPKQKSSSEMLDDAKKDLEASDESDDIPEDSTENEANSNTSAKDEE